MSHFGSGWAALTVLASCLVLLLPTLPECASTSPSGPIFLLFEDSTSSFSLRAGPLRWTCASEL